MTVVEGERSPPTLRRWCGQAECDASIQEKRLLVASCVDTILGEVHLVVTSQRVVVTCQRRHGNTAGECEDEDHRGYEGLHGWPRLVLEWILNTATIGVLAKNEREGIHTVRDFQGVGP